MTNEQQVEEILHKAYSKGFAKELLEKAGALTRRGVNHTEAYITAYIELNEIYRREHPRQSKT